VVLGAPDFTTFVEPDLTQQKNNVTASLVLNPVAVSSDGVHLFVTDLGYNRVLIWNSIPTANGVPADVAVGQPDLVSSIANNAYSTSSTDTTVPPVQTPVLCTVSNGTDVNSNLTYPTYCNATLSFPRFALAVNNRLFIADGGNDRVLVFNRFPPRAALRGPGESARSGGTVNQASDAADSLRTPMSLAWDGTNLYVSDAYNRRITVYSMGENTVPYAGVVNSASLNIVAKGTVTFTAPSRAPNHHPLRTPTVQAGDVIDINIGGTSTTTPPAPTTTTTSPAASTTNTPCWRPTPSVPSSPRWRILINAANSGAGDTNVYATPDLATGVLLLTSRLSRHQRQRYYIFCTITPVSTATTAGISGTTSGATLSGGGDAASLAPGTIAQVQGTNLSFHTASADTTKALPTKLGGTQVYFNGIPAPLVMVSPTAINAQIPWELGDTTSINAYVRSESDDGT
jgi:hypothetical protein